MADVENETGGGGLGTRRGGAMAGANEDGAVVERPEALQPSRFLGVDLGQLGTEAVEEESKGKAMALSVVAD